MISIRPVVAAVLLAASGAAFADGDWSLIPIPGAFYTPETSVGLAAFGLGTWTPDDEGLKPHMYQGGAVYTLKNQVSLIATSEIYLLDDALRLNGGATFSLFPDRYFGIGPEADLDEDYTQRDTRLAITAGWRVARNLYAGPLYRLVFSSLVEAEAGGELEGTGRSVSSGGGALIVWDSRDAAVYPRAGRYVSLEAAGYPRALGSSDEWLNLALDARSYHSLFGSHVLALQALAARTSGDVPFRDLPRIGGDALMRGYYDGRYRDKAMLALQAEYRFPIFWRLGGVVFGGAAQVAPAFADMRLEDPRLAGGAGLRLTLQESQHVNLRVDFGVAPGSSGFYLRVTEAF